MHSSLALCWFAKQLKTNAHQFKTHLRAVVWRCVFKLALFEWKCKSLLCLADVPSQTEWIDLAHVYGKALFLLVQFAELWQVVFCLAGKDTTASFVYGPNHHQIKAIQCVELERHPCPVGMLWQVLPVSQAQCWTSSNISSLVASTSVEFWMSPASLPSWKKS